MSVCEDAMISNMEDTDKLKIMNKKIAQVEALGLCLSELKAAKSEYTVLVKTVSEPKIVEKNNNVICKVCSASFRNEFHVQRHMNVMHKNAVKCEKCSKEFTDKYNMKLHMKSCLWKCNQCPYNTLRRNEMNNHMKKKHGLTNI